MKDLRDIKPLIDVPDNSMMIIILATIALILSALLIIWWIKQPKRRRKRRLSKKELAKERLRLINFDDTKDAVYTFSQDMRVLADDEKRDELEKFIDKLEIYKFKKDIPPLSGEDRDMMKKMIKEIGDV
jgi:Flp pilus assembly protein TadB